jgi:hypothetical protein
MEDFATVIILLCLVALAGVVIYFIIDYMKRNKEVDADIDKAEADVSAAKSAVNTEKLDRMSNLKYVVDQVNTVNTDIYTDVTSNTSSINTIQSTQNSLLTGLGSFLSFSSNGSLASSGSSMSILNLPGAANVDVNLMQRVNATMGLRATDLSPTKPVQFCAASDPSRCIKIPAANGDLYLTPMSSAQTSAIVMDAPNVNATGAMTANTFKFGSNAGAITTMPDGTLNLSGPNKIVINSGASPTQNIVTFDPVANTVTIASSNIILTGDAKISGNLCMGNTCIGQSNLTDLRDMRTQITTNAINMTDSANTPRWDIKADARSLMFRDVATGNGDYRYAMFPGKYVDM